MSPADVARLPTRRSFDSLVDQAATAMVSVDEVEILRDSHWAFGEDARLREDVRFKQTPWGRWVLAGA
jgi:hypothetical protein